MYDHEAPAEFLDIKKGRKPRNTVPLKVYKMNAYQYRKAKNTSGLIYLPPRHKGLPLLLAEQRGRGGQGEGGGEIISARAALLLFHQTAILCHGEKETQRTKTRVFLPFKMGFSIFSFLSLF